MFYAIESPYNENLVCDDGMHAGVVHPFERLADLRDFCRDAQGWNGVHRFRINRFEAYSIMEDYVKVHGYARNEDFSSVTELCSLYIGCVNRWEG